MRWSRVPFCALLCAACGGIQGGADAGAPDADTTPDAFECPADQAPAAPEILTPVAGRIDVVPDDLVLETSAFSDPDPEDTHGGTEFEIWSLHTNGTADQRVWHATSYGAPTLTRVAVADGEHDVPFEQWKDYAVRARYRDHRGDCSQWSAWSGIRTFRSDDGSSYLFDPTVIRDVYLTIPPASWDAINAEAYPSGCKPYSRHYYPGTLEFEGQVFDDVGIHIKGGCGSSRNLNGKASFKVNLEWDDPAVDGCPAPRRLGGQKHLTLNNGVQDQTATHERLAYPVYAELGVPAPRVASVRVHVNGVLWGLYQNVESVDRRFLERRFASSRGMLYEGTYWCDLIPANVPDTEDDDSGCLTREFTPGVCDAPPEVGDDPMDYTLVRQLVNQIQAMPAGGFYPEVEAFFEFDTFLTQWAIEAFISHWDAYEFSIINNYRVYHDPVTGRWSIIPTGIDQTFIGDQDPWGVYGVLAARCRNEPDCDAAFAARLAQVNQHFVADDMVARAQAIRAQITPDVYADPRKEYSNATFDQAQNDMIGYLAGRPGRINEHLTAHGY